MLVKRVQRLLEKVAERHYEEHAAKADQGGPSAPTNEDKCASNELHERYDGADEPERPDGKKRVLVR